MKYRKGNPRTLLTYSTALRRRPTRSELDAIIAIAPVRPFIERTTAIAAIAFLDGGIESDRYQRQVINALLNGSTIHRQIIELLDDKEFSYVLFTRETLMAMFRIAAVLDSSGSNGKADVQDVGEVLVKAALAVNEFLAEELDPPAATRTGTALDMERSELRSLLSDHENPHLRLGRMSRFFEWSRTATAQNLDGALKLDDDILDFTGLTLQEYMAGAYALLSRTAALKSWEDFQRAGVTFTGSSFLRHCARPDVVRRWISFHTCKVAPMQRLWQKQKSLSWAALGQLWKQPVLELSDGMLIVPSLDLMNNRFDAGLYWTMFDAYKKRKIGMEETFSRFYGRYFENYVIDRFESGYARTAVECRRQVEYEPGVLSTDLVIAEGGNVIFVEVCAKRLNFVRSILNLDRETIDADFRLGIYEKLGQLDTNIRAFREGRLFPETPRPAGQRIFPVLVLPTSWPRIALLAGGLVSNVLAERGWLNDTEPVEILDVGEVEELEHIVSERSLSELLLRKNASRIGRATSMMTYLYENKQRWSRSGKTPAMNYGNEAVLRVKAMAESWFLPVAAADVEVSVSDPAD